MECFLISARDFRQQMDKVVGTQAGVYTLHCLRKPDESAFIPTSRLLGVDPDGVLYIGFAGCLRDEVTQLYKALSAAAHRHGYTVLDVHQVGRRYLPSVQEKYEYDFLCVVLHPVSTKEDRLAFIGFGVDMLSRYEARFGELPPFNGCESETLSRRR